MNNAATQLVFKSAARIEAEPVAACNVRGLTTLWRRNRLLFLRSPGLGGTPPPHLIARAQIDHL